MFSLTGTPVGRYVGVPVDRPEFGPGRHVLEWVIDLTNRPKMEYQICPVYNSLNSEFNLGRFGRSTADLNRFKPVGRDRGALWSVQVDMF